MSELLASILLSASVAFRAASVGAEFEQQQNIYFPGFAPILANICESLFLRLVVGCVLKS